jgi:hypothetical protein
VLKLSIFIFSFVISFELFAAFKIKDVNRAQTHLVIVSEGESSAINKGDEFQVSENCQVKVIKTKSTAKAIASVGDCSNKNLLVSGQEIFKADSNLATDNSSFNFVPNKRSRLFFSINFTNSAHQYGEASGTASRVDYIYKSAALGFSYEYVFGEEEKAFGLGIHYETERDIVNATEQSSGSVGSTNSEINFSSTTIFFNGYTDFNKNVQGYFGFGLTMPSFSNLAATANINSAFAMQTGVVISSGKENQYLFQLSVRTSTHYATAANYVGYLYLNSIYGMAGWAF